MREGMQCSNLPHRLQLLMVLILQLLIGWQTLKRQHRPITDERSEIHMLSDHQFIQWGLNSLFAMPKPS